MMQKRSTQDIRKLHEDILFLYKDLLVPFIEVERDLPFAGKAKRPENDAEHSYLLSMVALSLEQKLGLGLDRGLVAQYALVHDLVEAYVGDVSAKADEEQQKIKLENEAIALEKIQQTYQHTFSWIGEACKKYEERHDKESRFVYAVDKLMGAYTWLASDFSEWYNHYPDDNMALLNTTVDRLRGKFTTHHDDLVDLYDTLSDMLKDRVRTI